MKTSERINYLYKLCQIREILSKQYDTKLISETDDPYLITTSIQDDIEVKIHFKPSYEYLIDNKAEDIVEDTISKFNIKKGK